MIGIKVKIIWDKLSIRYQLTLLFLVAFIFIQASTIGLVYWFEIKERKSLALYDSNTLGLVLKHDLIKVILNPRADTFSDISFR